MRKLCKVILTTGSAWLSIWTVYSWNPGIYMLDQHRSKCVSKTTASVPPEKLPQRLILEPKLRLGKSEAPKGRTKYLRDNKLSK